MVKGNRPDDYANHKLPVYISSNLYYNKALPFNREKFSLESRTYSPKISIDREGDALFINLEIDNSFKEMNTELITTKVMGTAFQSEEAFENNDSSPVSIDVDINGQNRSYNPTVGPFERLKKGKNRIKIFTFNHQK